MNLISLHQVSLTLGAQPIFQNLSWEIQNQQRIGLIGSNGAGKSSLLKLITGEFTPEPGGRVVMTRGVSLGYLPQQPEFDPQQTPLQVVSSALPRLRRVYEELEKIEESLADPDVYGDEKRLSRALERQQALVEEEQALGGVQFDRRMRETLRGLGLAEAEFEKPVGLLSGGQKKLVGLAGLLLAAPQVLLLDEPDNHLDLPGKEFLERLILTYPGAVVIISHDRYLLDAVVTHIAELEDGRLTTFQGDYSAYILEKQERLARQEELYQVQQREIARIEAAIKRYAVWAKVYDVGKFARRAKAIQNRLNRLERIERPLMERRRIDLRLNGWRGSSKVLEFKAAEKRFGSQVVLKPLNFTLFHGQRVGLIGPNGAGKSVLLKLALGELAPDSGEILRGPSIRCGYYAQEHETLNPEATVLDTVRYAGNLSESSAVALLGRYLFSYRQAGQKVKELSGGERSRLQLALVVLSGANFLLLDEPTNNLDIPSAEILEDALADFEGTLLVISHDRYFLDRVVDSLLVLRAGEVRAYPGGYSDYLLNQAGG